MKHLVLLVAACLLAHPVHADKLRVMRLQTADDVVIAAAYYPATSVQAPAVVLLHAFGQSRDEWGSFPLLLQHNDIAVLAIDFRGHGESTRRITARGPQLMDYHNFTQQDFQNMLLDINTAVDWLEEQKGIDRKRIALVGSSLGANMAVHYAREHDDLAALVLLSPGLAYKDIRIDEIFPKLRRMPVRVVASAQDSFAYQSARQLLDLRKQSGHASDFKELIACSGNLHGAEQLKSVKELSGVLIRWLRQVLFKEVSEEVAPLPLPSPTPTNAPPVKVQRKHSPQKPLP